MGLIFLRHPRVAAPGLCYGRKDVPLAVGAEEAVARAVLRVPKARRLISSPSARCRVLAEGVAGALGLAAEIDPRLLELDFGAWEGRLWAEIPRTESDPWAQDPLRRAPPGGERFLDLQARVAAALLGLDNAVIVTHAGVIRAAQILANQATFDQAFAQVVPYAEPIYIPALEGAFDDKGI